MIEKRERNGYIKHKETTSSEEWFEMEYFVHAVTIETTSSEEWFEWSTLYTL